MHSRFAALVISALLLFGYWGHSSEAVGRNNSPIKEEARSTPSVSKIWMDESPFVVETFDKSPKDVSEIHTVIWILNNNRYETVPKIIDESVDERGFLSIVYDVTDVVPIQILTDEIRMGMIKTIDYLADLGLHIDVENKADLVQCFGIASKGRENRLVLIRVAGIRMGEPVQIEATRGLLDNGSHIHI